MATNVTSGSHAALQVSRGLCVIYWWFAPWFTLLFWTSATYGKYVNAGRNHASFFDIARIYFRYLEDLSGPHVGCCGSGCGLGDGVDARACRPVTVKCKLPAWLYTDSWSPSVGGFQSRRELLGYSIETRSNSRLSQRGDILFLVSVIMLGDNASRPKGWTGVGL